VDAANRNGLSAAACPSNASPRQIESPLSRLASPSAHRGIGPSRLSDPRAQPAGTDSVTEAAQGQVDGRSGHNNMLCLKGIAG